jgi:hypothetical protein
MPTDDSSHTPLEFPEHMTLQLAFHLLDSVHTQIRVADEKIRALFGASALLAAAITITGNQPTTFSQLGNLAVPHTLIALVRGMLFVAVIFSAVAAVLALLPRVTIRGRLPSLFFFGDVAAIEHDTFLRTFSALSEDAALSQILSQVHVNSSIVRVKYRWASRAAFGFITALVLWAIVQALGFLL